MGVDPVTGIVSLTILTGVALALYIEECEREEERRRQQEEDRRRWRKEEEKRERKARTERLREERERKKMEREEREREKMEMVERERRYRMEREERRRMQEEAEERRRNASYLCGYDPFQTSEEYRRSQPFHTTNQREYSFNSYSYVYDNEAKNEDCACWSCILRRDGKPPGAADFYETFSSEFDPFQTSEEHYRSEPFHSSYRYDNVAENRNCDCWSYTGGSPPRAVSPSRAVSLYDPFSSTKGSVTLTITQTQTAPNKNQNEGSSNKPTSSSSQNATSSKSTSKQNTNAPKNLSSGSDQPQRNNNNNNNNNNNSDKKDTVQELNDFMEILKAILDRCKVSKELREKILAFFNKFEKHEENFLRLLEDFRIQNIAIEDIVSIVVRLFQSDYFAEDVAYPNFLALMEIVAKYIKDELIIEMVEDSRRGSKKSHEQQREECMKKVLQRENILSEITALFEEVRKEIAEDNDRKPLNPDFSGIFGKVYHYIKHKVVRGKEWTVTEYFDWVRKVLVLLKNLTPEYGELCNVNHARRQIMFEMYSTAYGGYFRIVVRAYGPVIQICTFFLREKRDKKAKDGDKYVDGKKKS
ncbi:J domain-containing protein DDB_G0295729-like [Aricia agestis]|uniref:J domain-containing protein DDB_G0295729-like n=1 Tax=Aricia agestis TaxID=91739 RepID=UPI001C206D34|nr:J domain-containing protein DDB_G0295729-like [Aricia agestis]XP_041983287.1 J domain-containing protein DDB_G0295729-like [Aricia agestis]XP_041983289.1 J domain-containing protein DDB_G0295729-like [Aricia agestis]XP_041983290.1 J domain-containing protein DDB_G0295729-like [Aricia agestis]XP_041983291.1 J domain-containing protein DDB_G0295729-like [Aricia agestis]XP_041983292.1 J domain-containing protein DDB_G0295729-like [Aricia agestis]